ncbi:MAG: hypothetical protein KGQ83_08455, partial [Planctomycetes bacterium]|nr:hypothetical protein [Planctomycetota bacterium]
VFNARRMKSPRPPQLYHSPKEKFADIKLDALSLEDREFMKIPEIKRLTPQIKLPSNMKISIDKDNIIIKNRFVQIKLIPKVDGWGNMGLDFRLMEILGSSIKRTDVISLSAYITFEAELDPLYSLFPESAIYWTFANEALTNLQTSYSWSRFMEEYKELLTWEHILK